MKINPKNIWQPTLILFTICALLTAALGATNLITKNQIKKMDFAKQTEAVKKVLPADEYQQKTVTLDDTKYQGFIAKKDGSIIGYAFAVSARGYSSEVSAIVGIKIDGSINAVELTNVSGETPGLGQNTGKSKFVDQYNGKSGEVKVVKNNAGEGEVNAVTGATITSNAVTAAVNKALKLYTVLKGENS